VYALEDEPESGARWRRLGLGALITALVLTAIAHGAQRYEPARRLIQRVVQVTVLPDPPKPERLLPPRTEPPPPPVKRAPPQKATAPASSAPKTPAPQPRSAEPVVGLSEGSFGSGAGAHFQVGTTQLGDPSSARAQRLGLEGMLLIEAEIDATGHVSAARLRRSLEEAIDRECLEAVRSAQFQPATLNGSAVASVRLLRLRFELGR
jgi:TonB family protein